ncbi:MAG: hypothetical protein AAF735_08350 [Myxococcota bacterium]
MAHAVWSVSDGETLVPMLASESNQERKMTRLAHERLKDSVAEGHSRLEANTDGFQRAAFIYDGYIHLEDRKTDALIMTVIQYGSDGGTVQMAIPYKPASSGFAVHRPKFLSIDGIGEEEVQTLGEAFFAGVDKHEEGSKVWSGHLDESR